MTQLDSIKRALHVFGPPDPESPVALALVGVLKATLEVKQWEEEVGDVTECECDQCVTTTALADAIIKEMEGVSID